MCVDGIVLVVGQVGESGVDAVPMFAALLHTCIVRGILAASRNQFRELVRFIDEHEILPAMMWCSSWLRQRAHTDASRKRNTLLKF